MTKLFLKVIVFFVIDTEAFENREGNNKTHLIYCELFYLHKPVESQLLALPYFLSVK